MDYHQKNILSKNGEKNCIILFKGGFQYNVVNYFVDDLAESFVKLGFTSRVIDLTKNDFAAKLQEQINKGNIKCFFAFNGIGLPSLGELAVELKVPFINFYLDSPIYHLQRLQYKSENLKIIFIDKNDLQFSNEILNQEASFIPHGAFTKLNSAGVSKNKSGIIFAGSITKPELLRNQWLKLGKAIGEIYDSLLEYVINKEYFNIKHDVDYILKVKGIELSMEQKKTIYFNSIFVHKYVRQYRRLKVLEALKDFKIDLYGNGWNTVPIHPNHTYHGAVDFLELIERVKKSSLMLNVLPEFIYGGHERIFTAMYHGTACLTNYNAYLKTNFENGKDLLFYSMRDLKQLPDQLSVWLSDKMALEQIARSGMEKVKTHHTWLNRAQDLLHLIETDLSN